MILSDWNANLLALPNHSFQHIVTAQQKKHNAFCGGQLVEIPHLRQK